MSYLKVEGNTSLSRDPITNSIINTNSNDYQEYVKRRNVNYSEQQKIQNLENDLNKIKDDINEIKTLLRSMIK
jgi:hypothetical protein